MQHSKRKQYVEVQATHYIDGEVRPIRITFAEGPTYEIESVKRRGRVKTVTGDNAVQYTILIHGQETCLYEDSGRWFVLMKEPIGVDTS